VVVSDELAELVSWSGEQVQHLRTLGLLGAKTNAAPCELAERLVAYLPAA
jgi:hypothetical protein